jgi:putative endonuclease
MAMFKGGFRSRPDTGARGQAAEEAALAHLQRAGLRLLVRNYRVAAGPSRPAGEVDLILRDRDGTLVFVEVRARADASHGGAAASVTVHKQRRLIYAAQHYLLSHATLPPCRFDVVALDGDTLTWLQGAFETS